MNKRLLWCVFYFGIIGPVIGAVFAILLLIALSSLVGDSSFEYGYSAIHMRSSSPP